MRSRVRPHITNGADKFAVIYGDHAEGGRLMPDMIEHQRVRGIMIDATADGWPEPGLTWLPEWLPSLFEVFELSS